MAKLVLWGVASHSTLMNTPRRRRRTRRSRAVPRRTGAARRPHRRSATRRPSPSGRIQSLPRLLARADPAVPARGRGVHRERGVGHAESPQNVDVDLARPPRRRGGGGGEFDLAFSARPADRSRTVARDPVPARRARRPDRPARGQRVRASSRLRSGGAKASPWHWRDAIASYPARDPGGWPSSLRAGCRPAAWPTGGPARRGRGLMVQAWLDGRENWSDYDVRRARSSGPPRPRSHPSSTTAPRPVRRRQGR